MLNFHEKKTNIVEFNPCRTEIQVSRSKQF